MDIYTVMLLTSLIDITVDMLSDYHFHASVFLLPGEGQSYGLFDQPVPTLSDHGNAC